jgi:hypothetical protein
MIKKTMSEKEQALLNTIAAAKIKLDKLHQKQKLSLGELAIKYNLHLVDKKDLEKSFKKLGVELNVE